MSVRSAIEAGGKALADGINGKNAAAAAACYTDGCVMAPGQESLNGKHAIQALWQGFIDAGLANVALTSVEVEELGDTATELGHVTATLPAEGGGQTDLVGKYVVIWKKGADGDWRMHRDIWNFDA